MSDLGHDMECGTEPEGFWYCTASGALYGPCEDPGCGGGCEYKGQCDCWCHETEGER